MISNYQITLGGILFISTVGNVFSSMILTRIIDIAVHGGEANGIEMVAEFILAFIILIFCEYLPKAIGKKNPIV
jgi:Mg2+/Co2+ transporter CorB